MEHHYEIPKVSDIELYYDLVSAFISVLQGIIFTLHHNRESEYIIEMDERGKSNFSSEYDDENLEITIRFWSPDLDEEETVLTANITGLEDFIYFF